MLTIRLSRVGRKNDPSFRVVVVDSKRKVKAGNYLEMVGSYDPRVDRIELKAERIKHWMQHGAQVSDTVHNLLISQKIISGKKINILPKFVPAPSAVEVAPEAPAAEAAPAPAEAAPAAEAPVAETTEPVPSVGEGEKAEATEAAAPTEDNPVATEESAQ